MNNDRFKLNSSVLFIAFLLFCNIVLAIKPEKKYALIPLPVKLVPIEGEFVINAKTTIYADIKDLEIQNAVNQLNTNIETWTRGKLTIIEKKNRKNQIAFIKDSGIHHVEGYKLTVTEKRIEVKYKTAHGAFNAVQTMRQLLPLAEPLKAIIPACSIEDYPQLEYRGYLLDVARHFYPVSFIKKMIDALAYYKINVLHLHLTEDQGWRIEIKKYPKLTEIGAWRNETLIGYPKDVPHKFDGIKHGGYYTQKELKELVQYAKERFIRVIPEIDIPGHSQALLAAYPQYGCIDSTYTVSTIWGVHDNILCPTEETFSFLQDIFDEVMTVFPDKNIHIGGDEVPKRRWEESKFCQDLIAKNNLKDEHGLQSYFIQRIESYLNSKGRIIIGWDEILEGGLAPNATVMSWRGEKGGIEAAKQKHNVIMTPIQFMYINFYNTKFRQILEPLSHSAVLPLKKVYNYNPFPKELSSDESKYIIGLQASLWTEYCKTEQKAESLTFPRLCAMSEVAWSPVAMKNYDGFYQRLIQNIKYLDMMNINYSKLFLNPENNQ